MEKYFTPKKPIVGRRKTAQLSGAQITEIREHTVFTAEKKIQNNDALGSLGFFAGLLAGLSLRYCCSCEHPLQPSLTMAAQRY